MLKCLRNSLVGVLGAPLLRLLWNSLRITVDDRGGLLQHNPGEKLIFAFWHNRMLLMAPFYRARLPHRRCVCLISASSDGEMISRVVEGFGIKSARGSSSRRGKEALLELANQFQSGFDVAITPDGPRGPRYEVQQGIIGLAQLTGAPVFPVSYVAERKIELGSWDGFMIPLPFSRCRIVIGEPLSVPKTRSDEEFERERRKLEATLLELGQDASGGSFSRSHECVEEGEMGRRGDGEKTIQK